jgi:hypothetical protein
MKNLQNLKGAQQLSKKEQQSINGGDHLTPPHITCITSGGTWSDGVIGGCVYDPIDPPQEE